MKIKNNLVIKSLHGLSNKYLEDSNFGVRYNIHTYKVPCTRCKVAVLLGSWRARGYDRLLYRIDHRRGRSRKKLQTIEHGELVPI